MEFNDLVLVAVVDEVSDEPKARPFADAIEYRFSDEDIDSDLLDGYAGELPIIATIGPRETTSDGVRERGLKSLRSAIAHDFVEAVSVEFDVAKENEQILELFREADADIIISYHNFVETPDLQNLLSIVEDAAELGDVVKIATMAETPNDTLTLLSTIDKATQKGILIGGVSMGEIGRHTRVIASSYGSKLAFAPLNTDTKYTVPGQFSLEGLAELIEETENPSNPTSLHDAISNPHLTDE